MRVILPTAENRYGDMSMNLYFADHKLKSQRFYFFKVERRSIINFEVKALANDFH